MPNQEKLKRIEELTSERALLQDQKRRLEAEAEAIAEKRNKLNEALKNLRVEILETRKVRNNINLKVKELKEQKEEIKREKDRKIEELKILMREMEDLEKRKPNKNPQMLEREVKSLEWKIQTTPLSLQDEKKLIERVKQLETQLNIYRKIEQLAQKSLELKAEIKAMQARIKRYGEEISEKAKESQEFHEKMLEKINEAEKLKAEADHLHQLFLQYKEKIRPVQSEIDRISNEIRQLRVEILAEAEEERKKREEEFLADIERQAREKLRRGEKLTLEEFKLLMEKGIAQN
ncbi:MAG: hypothetical protein QXW82_03590 [Candidatus Bathyarchaeia archaeon]